VVIPCPSPRPAPPQLEGRFLGLVNLGGAGRPVAPINVHTKWPTPQPCHSQFRETAPLLRSAVSQRGPAEAALPDPQWLHGRAVALGTAGSVLLPTFPAPCPGEAVFLTCRHTAARPAGSWGQSCEVMGAGRGGPGIGQPLLRALREQGPKQRPASAPPTRALLTSWRTWCPEHSSPSAAWVGGPACPRGSAWSLGAQGWAPPWSLLGEGSGRRCSRCPT